MTKTNLFPSAPRRPRRVLMHVVDAGEWYGGNGKGIQFSCQTCGHDTGWIKDTRTVTENKRGIPCPKCNGGEHG